MKLMVPIIFLLLYIIYNFYIMYKIILGGGKKNLLEVHNDEIYVLFSEK